MITKKSAQNLTFSIIKGPKLPEFVKDIVEIRGRDVETKKRLYPRNTPEILINLAKPIQGEVAGKTAVIKDCTIQGCKTELVNAWHPRNCHFLSIRFTPNGYYKLLGVSQLSFTDQVFKLQDIMDRELESLIPILQQALTVKERFQILINWLNKSGHQPQYDSELVSDFIISQLNRRPEMSVKQLTDRTGYSRKHLVERFKEETGLTIKKYQKIFRMYRVLKKIDRRKHISWARLACHFGFYDQSHFIRDFKKYTGFTPSEYLNQQSSPKSLAS